MITSNRRRLRLEYLESRTCPSGTTTPATGLQGHPGGDEVEEVEHEEVRHEADHSSPHSGSDHAEDEQECEDSIPEIGEGASSEDESHSGSGNGVDSHSGSGHGEDPEPDTSGPGGSGGIGFPANGSGSGSSAEPTPATPPLTPSSPSFDPNQPTGSPHAASILTSAASLASPLPIDVEDAPLASSLDPVASPFLAESSSERLVTRIEAYTSVVQSRTQTENIWFAGVNAGPQTPLPLPAGGSSRGEANTDLEDQEEAPVPEGSNPSPTDLVTESHVAELVTPSFGANLASLEQGIDRFLALVRTTPEQLERLLRQPQGGWWYVGGSLALGTMALTLYSWSRSRQRADSGADDLLYDRPRPGDLPFYPGDLP